MIVELFSPPPEFQIFRKKYFKFYETSDCVVQIEAVVFTHLTKVS